MTTESLGKTYW